MALALALRKQSSQTDVNVSLRGPLTQENL